MTSELRRSTRSTRGKHSRNDNTDDIFYDNSTKKQKLENVQETSLDGSDNSSVNVGVRAGGEVGVDIGIGIGIGSGNEYESYNHGINGRVSLNSPGIRCICDIELEKDAMINCHNCKYSQHLECVWDKNSGKNLLVPYLCHLCVPKSSKPLNVNVETPSTSIVPNQLSVPESPVHTTTSEVPEEKNKTVSYCIWFTSLTNSFTNTFLQGIESIENVVRKSVASTFCSTFKNNILPVASKNSDFGNKDQDLEILAENLSVSVEQALFDKFALKVKGKDVGNKYRAKFRSLLSTLKDANNPELHLKIVNGDITPSQFVTMTSEELMNPLLRKITEEAIEKSIKDSILKVETGPRIRRTHKGEEYVGDQFLDQDLNITSSWKPKENIDSNKVETEPESGESESPVPHLALVEPNRQLTPPEGKENYEDYNNGENGTESNVHIEDDEDLDAILGNNVDEDYQEDDPLLSKSSLKTEKKSYNKLIYKGQLHMPLVSNCQVSVHELSAPNEYSLSAWNSAFNSMGKLFIEGRLDSSKAIKYLKVVGMSKDICTFFILPDAANAEHFDKLYTYFRRKNKFGVLTKPKQGPAVKDAYVIPLQHGDDIPEYLGLRSTDDYVALEQLLQTYGRGMVGLFVLSQKFLPTKKTSEDILKETEKLLSQLNGKISDSSDDVSNVKNILSMLKNIGGAPENQNQFQTENDDSYEP